MIKKTMAVLTIISFLILDILPYKIVFAQEQLFLPPVGQILPLSPEFTPLMIKGIKIHQDNPFEFDFIINQGQENLPKRQFKEESLRLVKYFMASLTIPENDLWVNLSPYEKNRITTPELGITEMGKDLLSQDYVLKQLTSSLIYPEGETGKRFWTRVYALAQEKYHTTNIPINTFNKVWIVPQKAVVYENSTGQTAYVIESNLKVMLEEDYLALQKHNDVSNSIGNQIVREIVIPELTREVNYGKNFANLRQITNSLILAAWFKRALKASILAKLYVDQKKITGVDLLDRTVRERIYQQYLRAYKKGVYNYIKEDEDPVTGEIIPRKYFSGGYKFIPGSIEVRNAVEPAEFNGEKNDRAVTVKLNNTIDDAAMVGDVQHVENIPDVRKIFEPLGFLLDQMLEKFGRMPETSNDQREFANANIGDLQKWLDIHFIDLLALQKFLPVPGDRERYTRNLVKQLKSKGIFVFMHLLGPGMATPKHWHSENGVNALGFAAILGEGGIEIKWRQESVTVDNITHTRSVNLKDAQLTPLSSGRLVAIPGDYGVHQVINTSEKPLILFEFYFEPQELNNIDVPLPVMGSSTDYFVDTTPTHWLTDTNLYYTALREDWKSVMRQNALKLILSDPDARSFSINNKETVLVPSEEVLSFLRSSSLTLQGPGKRYLILPEDRAMAVIPRLAIEAELKNPGRTFLTADGITRDGSYTFKEEDLPKGPVDVVIIGAGASGLATGIQTVDSNLKTVVLEGGYVAQSFSDAFMNFWQQRTPAFRFSLVQKGFNSSRLQYLNLATPGVLSKLRILALAAAQRVHQVLGKDFSIARPAGFDNLTNATVPIARAEAFQHFLAVANAIVERGGLIRESDPVKSVIKREDGLFEVTTKEGITVITKNVVYATGLGNERMPEIFSKLFADQPENYTLIATPQEIPGNGLNDSAKLPIFASQVLNDPRVIQFVHALPEGGSIGVVGGGQSAGNSVAFIHSIRPNIIVHVFTRNPLKVHGSQMPAGFRKAHLMWEYVNDGDLKKDSWSKGGPQAVDTPITPPIFNHINKSVEEGTTVVHVLGKYFDDNNFEIQTEGTIARVIDKQNGQEIAVINRGGFISAIGYTLKSPQRNELYINAQHHGLIQIDDNGIIKIGPNGLTSSLDRHVYIAGVQLLEEGAVTDGSTHGTVVRARAIAEDITYGSVPRLEKWDRVRKTIEDYHAFLELTGNILDRDIVAAFLTLAKSQTGETLESIKSEYLKARESNAPLEAARYVADVAGQTGRDIVNGVTYSIPEFSEEAIIDRVFAVDMPGYLEGQNGKYKIRELFKIISGSKTSGVDSATEQLLYPATEYGVGQNKTFQVYDYFHSIQHIPEVAAVLTRATVTYLPFDNNINRYNAQSSSGINHKLNPGGIDLNTANLDLQIKHDGQGFPLPVEYQNLENIHINGLSPVIINVSPIADLSEFLKG